MFPFHFFPLLDVPQRLSSLSLFSHLSIALFLSEGTYALEHQLSPTESRAWLVRSERGETTRPRKRGHVVEEGIIDSLISTSLSSFPLSTHSLTHSLTHSPTTADAWTRDFERAEQLAADVANAIQVNRERRGERVFFSNLDVFFSTSSSSSPPLPRLHHLHLHFHLHHLTHPGAQLPPPGRRPGSLPPLRQRPQGPGHARSRHRQP